MRLSPGWRVCCWWMVGLMLLGGRAWERRGEDIHGTEIWKGLPGMCSSPHLTTRV